MRLEIKELQSKLGITSLYVTHDQVEAMTMADRMIVMNAGNAEQVGTPLDVYERPQTLFAAQFIGSPSMNIVSARLSGGRATLANGAVLSVNSAADVNVRLGIRPEHLVADANGPIHYDVALAEPLGANTLLHGKLQGVDDSFTANLPGIHRFDNTDGALRFSIDPANIHLFDADKGCRLN